MKTKMFKSSKFVTPNVDGYFLEINIVGKESKVYWTQNLKEAETKIKCCCEYNAIRGRMISSSVIYTDDTCERVAVYNPNGKKEARWSLSFRDGNGKRQWQSFASLV